MGKDTKKMPWFRMYAEFATDPKVQMLSEQHQRRYIMLLCLRCCNGDETLHDDAIAFQLRITNDEWSATKDVLMSKELITKEGKPTAWDKRQYLSDTSTERVKRHREKTKRSSNVAATPPEAETETDTDTEADISKKEVSAKSLVPSKNEKLEAFEAWYSRYPLKKGRKQAEKAWDKLTPDEMQRCIDVVNNPDFDAHMSKMVRGTKDFRKHPSTWLNGGCWEDEMVQSYKSQNGDPF